MEGFLYEVARDLYARYGEGLSERVVLFPSRRARLFFTDALARLARRPMWQPAWTTVDEMMAEIAGIRTGDRLRLLTELYEVYKRHHDEPFDAFYFWGDMLLADFDTIDKYRIDAAQLFRNLYDLKQIDADISYLTPEQLKIVEFWSSLGPEESLSEEKRRFLAIWRTLEPVYTEFRERLAELGIAYGGMVQRVAADRIRAGEGLPDASGRYVVAGFNALTACEKILFEHLKTACGADFYWDYDAYYKDDPAQEAGMFVRENLVRFPPPTLLRHNGMAQPKRIRSVAAVSNAVACKYAAEVLRDLAAKGPLGKETAVVLTDENLLMPLLYALPEEAGRVNVTMGYPLRSTLAYTFVERLVELQAHRRRKGAGWAFHHADAAGLAAHPYVAECDAEACRALQEEIVRERRIAVDAAWLGRTPLLECLFAPAEGWRALSHYLAEAVRTVARQPARAEDARVRNEFLAAVAEELEKLHNSLEACGTDITEEVYASLLRRHLQTVRIPYEGEPLEGVQVMGILETRNLDFENVVILSMNDDNFPGKRLQQASFVPYNLRLAHGLPTPEHHEAVYAYYFYRLIQRAGSVWMLYCSHADDKTTGEPSRYIHQLRYESGFEVEQIEAGVDVNLARTPPIEVAKDASVMERLERYVDPAQRATLSPTAFFRYVACPLRFYFHAIERIEADEELSEDVDAPMFGTILHAAAQRLYRRVEGEHRPGATLRAMLLTDEVAAEVGAAINEHFLRDARATQEDYTGNLLLVHRIVARYLRGGVMPYDAAHDAFTVCGLEEQIACDFPFEAGARTLKMKFAGVADRIDRLDEGLLRVVDYKTGAPHREFDGVESLFRGEGRQRLANILQTLLYAMMLARTRGCDTLPTLYYVREMHREGYSPLLEDKREGVRGATYAFYAEAFERLLRETLEEMYDPAIPFRQCDDADTCRFCDFNAICKR